MIASTTMQTAAQTGMRVISKTLTDRYLKKANDEYFGPRGLRVRLMKTEAMEYFVQKRVGKPQDDKIKSFGKAAYERVRQLGCIFRSQEESSTVSPVL